MAAFRVKLGANECVDVPLNPIHSLAFAVLYTVFRKSWVFFKKPNTLGFMGFVGLCWVLQTFYLNEQSGSLLVDLARQLSFYLDSPVL